MIAQGNPLKLCQTFLCLFKLLIKCKLFKFVTGDTIPILNEHLKKKYSCICVLSLFLSKKYRKKISYVVDFRFSM